MPPKKDSNASAPVGLIQGFDTRECKLLAAACISMVGPDKYNYSLFSELTGNTEGSLKKMWPPIKKKAMDEHPSFAAFITGSNAAPSSKDAAASKVSAAPKAAATKATTMKATPKKRKAEGDDENDDAEPTPSEGGLSPKKKRAPTKRASKKKGASDSDADSEGAASQANGGSPKKKAPAKRSPKQSKIEATKTEAVETDITQTEEVKAGDITTEAETSESERMLADAVEKEKDNKTELKSDNVDDAPGKLEFAPDSVHCSSNADNSTDDSIEVVTKKNSY